MVTMFWSYRVADWDAWAAAMQEEESRLRQRREKYGMVRRYVYRSVDDPNEVMLVAEFRTREGAEGLLRDPDGMRSWNERTGLEVFPPVILGEEQAHLRYSLEALPQRT